jgi:phosphoglycolate phosphatase-like HAD superfamily hydrolase
MKPYLIFDFDGVLGDTLEATLHVLSTLDNVTYDQAYKNLQYFFKKPHHARKNNISEAEYNKKLDWINLFGADLHDRGFALFDPFVDEISKIDTRHLAVVSSGSLKYIVPKLNQTELKFTHILGFEDHHSKEEKVEKICMDWGVGIKDVYYFTDTVSDVVELRDIMDMTKIIGCSWGFHGEDKLDTVLPKTQIMTRFDDIHTIIEV